MTTREIEQWPIAARAAYAQGNVEQARQFVKQVLSVQSEQPEAWLLVTYLTTNSEQQRAALDRAKRAAPQDERIRQREEELFPRRKARGVFVPENPDIPPQIIESAGGVSPRGQDILPSTDSSPVPLRRQPELPSAGRPSVSPASGPTLADGVVVKPRFRLSAYLPVLVALGVLVVCAGIGIGYNALNQRALQNSPSAVVLKFYPALQTGDNTTLDAILSDDAKAFCGDNLAVCLGQRSPIARFQNFAVSGEDLGDTTATVDLRFTDAQTVLCERFYTQKVDGDWKILKDDAPLPCTDQQQSVGAAPTQISSASTQPPTATLDATQRGVIQTSTLLAHTQNAMIAAPTLTAAVLAPGLTQTALTGNQNNLNTAIAATGTQSVLAATQTSQWVGIMTRTPVAKTQVAATATQAAMTFKSTLKGVLVVSKTIQGKPTLVTLNADGSAFHALNIVGIDPAWSPDGKAIVYTNREHQAWVHIVNADGSNDRELPSSTTPFGTGWASWSADGQKILFEGGTRMGLHAVFTDTLTGSATTQILDDTQSGGWTSWSLDGSQILDSKDDQVWIVNSRDGRSQAIAKQPGAQAAAWSPDGKQIAFDAGDDQDRALYTMNADGSALKQITSKGAYLTLPAWSPDSRWLVALCFDKRTNNNQVCVMNSDGTNLTAITTEGGFDGRISWRR